MDVIYHSIVSPAKIVTSPLTGNLYVKSGFGERFHPAFQKETLHAGINFRADYKMVHANAHGNIVREEYDSRSGNYLLIEHGWN